MKRPSPDTLFKVAVLMDMQIVDVLSDAGDINAAAEVRDWLLYQANQAKLRKACREKGIPVADARAAIAQDKESTNGLLSTF